MDDRKTDSAITIYRQISEKDYLTKAVRDMSRQLVGKTSGQEVVWKQCPNNWPSVLLGEWKNPTSKPKDDVDRLKKKYEFLKQNLPPDKFSDFQKNCFRLYESDEIDNLSQYVNLEKMKERVEEMLRYKSSLNSCDALPLVKSKEMEVRALIKQFLSSDLYSETSYKRKNSTSTTKSTKKRRVVSPCVSPSEQCNSAQCIFRPIRPKPVSTSAATTAVSLNPLTTPTSIPSNHPTAKTGLPLNHETAISTCVNYSVTTTPSYKQPDVQDITNTPSDCAATPRDQLHLYTEDQLPSSSQLYKSSPSLDSGELSTEAISSPEDQDLHSTRSPQEEEDVDSDFERFFNDPDDGDLEILNATKNCDIQNVCIQGLKEWQAELLGH